MVYKLRGKDKIPRYGNSMEVQERSNNFVDLPQVVKNVLVGEEEKSFIPLPRKYKIAKYKN